MHNTISDGQFHKEDRLEKVMFVDLEMNAHEISQSALLVGRWVVTVTPPMPRRLYVAEGIHACLTTRQTCG